MINIYKSNTAYTPDQYYSALLTYAKSQYKDGYPWIAEDLNARTGAWIANFDRSVNYNHSTFNDLIITRLVGIRPNNDAACVTINPLAGNNLGYFALENVSYRHHILTVLDVVSDTALDQ